LERDLVSIFVSALAAIFNPSLLAAVTIMLLTPHPKRLMLGYVLGAYATSFAVGFAVVFEIHGSGVLGSSRHTLSPAADVVIGAVALAVALALATDRDAPLRRWRARRSERKASRAGGVDRPSWQARLLSKGSARVTFVVGALLSFPGVTYLNALHHIIELDAGALYAGLLVVFFCVMQQLLIELPLVSYAFAPDWTPVAVSRSRAWLHRRGRRILLLVIAALGLVLIVRGSITLAG
jgi:hypothetical protein